MAKVTLNREDVIDLLRGLQTACSNPEVKGNGHFTYAMAKNRRLCKTEYESIQETLKALLTEYEGEMREVAKKFAKKDKDGNLELTPQNNPVINKIFIDDFNKEKDIINEKYKTQLEEKDVFLKGEITLELHLIKMSDFPEMQDYIADLLFPIREGV